MAQARGKHAPSRHVRAALIVGMAAGIFVVLLGGIAFSAYRYEQARADRFLPGVSIGGVNVGGMTHAQAVAAVRRSAAAQLFTTITVSAGSRTWSVTPAQLGEKAAVVHAVDQALAQDRSMGVLSRFWHGFRNQPVNRKVALHFAGASGVGTFVDQVAKAVDRKPVNAQLTTDGTTLIHVSAEAGPRAEQRGGGDRPAQRARPAPDLGGPFGRAGAAEGDGGDARAHDRRPGRPEPSVPLQGFQRRAELARRHGQAGVHHPAGTVEDLAEGGVADLVQPGSQRVGQRRPARRAGWDREPHGSARDCI